MKNKKIIYAIIGIAILISMVVIIAIISNKPMPIDHTPKESTSYSSLNPLYALYISFVSVS